MSKHVTNHICLYLGWSYKDTEGAWYARSGGVDVPIRIYPEDLHKMNALSLESLPAVLSLLAVMLGESFDDRLVIDTMLCGLRDARYVRVVLLPYLSVRALHEASALPYTLSGTLQ